LNDDFEELAFFIQPPEALDCCGSLSAALKVAYFKRRFSVISDHPDQPYETQKL
jgi:hypothetical protein